jgi:hypothetical protein
MGLLGCRTSCLYVHWFPTESLVQLLSGPLCCTVPGCTWQLIGAQQLIHHMAQNHNIPTNPQRRHAENLGNYISGTNLNQEALSPLSSGVLDQNLNWQQLGATHFEDPPLGGATVAETPVCFENCSKTENDEVKEEEIVDGSQKGSVRGFFSFSEANLEGSELREAK